MILYMTSTPGGFDRRTGLPEKLDNRNQFVDRLKNDWKDHSKGLLISSDPKNSEMNTAMAQTYLDAFNKSGLSMDSIDVLDARDEKIVEILTVQKPMYETITFRFNTVEEYFPEGTTGKQMQEIIMDLLRGYQKRWQKEREQAIEQER